MSLPETELIDKSKAGDAQAFSHLIGRYEDKIFSLARNVCATHPAEADDVYQETFLTAFKKIKHFRAKSELGTWLYRIAANLCWMKKRRIKRAPFVPILDLPGDGHEHDHAGVPENTLADRSADPEIHTGRKDLQTAVQKALQSLPVDYRLVVVLRDIEELPTKKVAEIMKLSVPAVKSRLLRGRLFLRDRLAGIAGRSAR